MRISKIDPNVTPFGSHKMDYDITPYRYQIRNLCMDCVYKGMIEEEAIHHIMKFLPKNNHSSSIFVNDLKTADSYTIDIVNDYQLHGKHSDIFILWCILECAYKYSNYLENVEQL